MSIRLGRWSPLNSRYMQAYAAIALFTKSMNANLPRFSTATVTLGAQLKARAALLALFLVRVRLLTVSSSQQLCANGCVASP